MRRILGYLKPMTARISLGFFIKFLGTITDLLIPSILAKILDDIVPTQNKKMILLWGGAMLACAFAAVFANIIANRMAARVAMRATGAIRHDLFDKIMHLSCSQIDRMTIPSLESRLTTDTYNLHHAFGMIQRMGVRAPILLVGGIAVTFSMEPVLTMILVAILPLISMLVYFVTKKGVPLYTIVQKSVDSLVRTVRENISGARVIKALSKTQYEKERFESTNMQLINSEKKAAKTMAVTNPTMNLLLNMGLTAVIILGAYRVNSGLTQPGKIIAFLSYFTIILNAMMSVTKIFVNLSKASASANRITEVLLMPKELEVQPLSRENEEAHLIFNDVSFSYHKQKENISGISFAVEKGGTLGIIGATGSGKSTVIQLLMRLYEADSGKILINGIPITAIPEDELHRKFGIVFQNDVLFADSIRENISFGRALDDETIKTAAENAQAMEFISALPDGFEHMLTIRGSNLSGGQKQRLLIARALAGKPEILILDDSSSALDYKTDSLLRKAINSNFKGTTTIIIAQRISSIYNCDHILVIDDGRELGYGTHEELMESCELYREIFMSQMGGGKIA